MQDPYQRLDDALDVLDTSITPFSEQLLTVGGCTHCYTTADLEALAGPVQAVPDELISSVAAEVTDHWDDFPTLYRRMTPKIVRLLVTGRLHVDHGLIASRLLAADWRNWTKPEREALEGVWDAWWRSTLHEYPGRGSATDVLETISASTGSLTPWLAVWAETRTKAADRHLRDSVDNWLLESQLADLRLGFYEELHATPQLVPWLLSLRDGRLSVDQHDQVKLITQG